MELLPAFCFAIVSGINVIFRIKISVFSTFKPASPAAPFRMLRTARPYRKQIKERRGISFLDAPHIAPDVSAVIVGICIA